MRTRSPKKGVGSTRTLQIRGKHVCRKPKQLPISDCALCSVRAQPALRPVATGGAHRRLCQTFMCRCVAVNEAARRSCRPGKRRCWRQDYASCADACQPSEPRRRRACEHTAVRKASATRVRCNAGAETSAASSSTSRARWHQYVSCADACQPSQPRRRCAYAHASARRPSASLARRKELAAASAASSSRSHVGCAYLRSLQRARSQLRGSRPPPKRTVNPSRPSSVAAQR